MPNEIAGGDVRDAEELGKAARVRAFPYAWAAQKHPLDASALGFCELRERICRESEVSSGIQR